MLDAQGFARPDLGCDAAVKGIELVTQQTDEGGNVGENAGIVFPAGAWCLPGQEIDDLASTPHQHRQSLGFLVPASFDPRAEQPAEGGQHAGVESIGLGGLARGLGQCADAMRRDQAGLQPSGVEGAQNRLFIAAAGFENRVGHALSLKPCSKLFPPLRSLGEASGLIARLKGNIAPALADVDAGIKWIGHDRSPARVRGFPPRNCSRQIKRNGRLSFARVATPQSIRQAARFGGPAQAPPKPHNTIQKIEP